jgi:hypothetical protein
MSPLNSATFFSVFKSIVYGWSSEQRLRVFFLPSFCGVFAPRLSNLCGLWLLLLLGWSKNPSQHSHCLTDRRTRVITSSVEVSPHRTADGSYWRNNRQTFLYLSSWERSSRSVESIRLYSHWTRVSVTFDFAAGNYVRLVLGQNFAQSRSSSVAGSGAW